MKELIGEIKRIMTRNKKSLFLFELSYKAVFIVTFIPLFQWLLRLTLRLSGFSYLTVENIAAFCRSPLTVLAFIILLLLLGFFTLLEIVSLIIYYYSSRKKTVRVDQMLFPGLTCLRRLFRRKSNLLLLFYGLLMTLFMILPLVVAFFTMSRIPSYIVKSAFGKNLIRNFLFAGSPLLILFVFFGLFLIHFCALEGKNIKEAYQASVVMLKRNFRKVLLYLCIWNALLILSYFVLYFGVLFLASIVVYFTVDDTLTAAVFLSSYDSINLFVGAFVAIIGMVANIFLSTHLFIRFRKQQDGSEDFGLELLKLQDGIDFEDKYAYFHVAKPRLICRGRYVLMTRAIMIAVILSCSIYIYNQVRNGFFVTQQALFGTLITAHRGASTLAPENTLPAVEGAVASYADYVELDVQETKDGVVILLHDANLKRTTGRNTNIWETDYLDLLKMDAGAWFSKEFYNTRVPTLEEVFTLYKGRIMFNIELKLNGHDKQLVEKVVQLIHDFGLENQCVVSSANYAALAKVKELNQEIKTGYILALAYGNFYDTEYADFFSIKSSFINEGMVKLSHSMGKEVHAWTVNSKSEMERLKQLRVDNIITDNPVLARKVLYEESEETFMGILRLLRK